MRHIAIIGSGPAGYYTAEAAQKQWGDDVRIDIFDMLPVPYGLIRTGVAPDHQSIKAVSNRYEKVALSDNVGFVGNVTVGRDVTISELQELYDAVVLATGAPHDRPLDLPGEHLGNVFGSAAFVGWYNGHPQFARLDPDLSGETAVVIGMGNVALDVARILLSDPEVLATTSIAPHALAELRRSKVREVVLLARGESASYTRNERLGFDAALAGTDRSAVFRHNVQVASISPDGVVTKEGEVIEAGLVLRAIGSRGVRTPGLPFDEGSGRIPNDRGRVAGVPGAYVVGWAKRGPSGGIGANRSCAKETVGELLEDAWAGVLPERGVTSRLGRVLELVGR